MTILVAYFFLVSGEPMRAVDGITPTSAPQPGCRMDAGLITVPNKVSATDPILVVFERNPWLMSVGSDFPTVVVYEDGRMLFIQREGRQAKVMMGHVDARAAATLRDSLVARGFTKAAAETTCSDWTDQVTVEILLRGGASWKMASAYGIGRDGRCKVAPPKAFLDAYTALQRLRPTDAKPFEPEEIAVEIWGFESAKGEPLPWPTEVPAPPTSVVPEEYGPYSPKSYRYVISARFRPQIDKLIRMMNSADPPRAVLLNGHRWTVVPRSLWQGYRLVEDVMRCAHRNLRSRPIE
jgi:hypothetical protein